MPASSAILNVQLIFDNCFVGISEGYEYQHNAAKNRKPNILNARKFKIRDTFWTDHVYIDFFFFSVVFTIKQFHFSWILASTSSLNIKTMTICSKKLVIIYKRVFLFIIGIPDLKRSNLIGTGKTRNVFKNLRFCGKRKDCTRQLTSILKRWHSQDYKLVHK